MTLVGVVLGGLAVLFMRPLVGIYNSEPEVIAAGVRRLRIIAGTYFLCGLMDVFCGILRGMGAAMVPMFVSIMGACAFRIFWIYAILPLNPSLEMLYYSYPVSWVLTGGVHLICCLVLMRRFPVHREQEELT